MATRLDPAERREQILDATLRLVARDGFAGVTLRDVASEIEQMQTFDIAGPLPTGTTLLEASAGTGKTWTIAALVTRYLAEGVATIIKTSPTMTRSWDTHFLSPLHEAMPEKLVLESELSAEESQPILRRIAAAARA